MIYFTLKIIKYLNFISDKNIIKKRIENHFQHQINIDHDNVMQNMIDRTKFDLKSIYECMNYLYHSDLDKKIFSEYINSLLKEQSINSDDIYFKTSKYIEDSKNKLNFQFDASELYKYIRNSIDDFNKETYYGFIYNVLVNNYYLYINNLEHNITNLVLVLFKALDDSKLSKNNGKELKNRIMNNLNVHMNEEYLITDKKYFNVFSYKFDIIKYSIDNKDYGLFEKFIRTNTLNYNENSIRYDLYLTCYIYLYYLIEVETIRYVTKNDKEVYRDFLDKIKKICDLSDFQCTKHYYDYFELYFANIYNVSNWWEKFDLSDQCDVKTCLVEPTITKFKKSLYIIFGYDIVNRKYNITDSIVELFKYDFENGKLKDDVTEKFKKILEYLEYDLKENEINTFEDEFINYIVSNYKMDELSKKIDINDLNAKLQNELPIIKENISKLEIVNNKKCKNHEECYYAIAYSKHFLDSFYRNKELLNDLRLEEGLEKYIYKCIENQIFNKNFYDYKDESIIVNKLSNIKQKYYYLRPKNDSLGFEWKYGKKYNRIISKFVIVNTSVSDARLLLKNYNCEIKSICLQLKEIDDKYIKSKLKKCFISRNKYCVQNEFGLDIFYTKQEIIKYLKNTEIIMEIKIEFGLDVIGSNNIAFMRKTRNNKK